MRFLWFLSVFVFLATFGFSPAEGRGKTRTHEVDTGETLWEISLIYGCDVERIQKANGLESNHIEVGQALKIPRCDDAQSRRRARHLILKHHVTEGDTLLRIAHHYDTSVEDLRRRNRLKNNFIRAGQILRVAVGRGGQGRPIAGQSVGSANNGRLVNGMQLPPAPWYHRRHPERAWGANHTIYHIRRAASIVRNTFPRIHKLSVGDISRQHGGPLSSHKSHQSGRDVDLGLYFKTRPPGYPNTFIKARKHTLHFEATWRLLKSLADTTDSPSGVERMFLNYEVQKLIYDWAKAQGTAKETLRRVFQYPRGETSRSGIIRHEPGHRAHVHVRFKCPANDKGCR